LYDDPNQPLQPKRGKKVLDMWIFNEFQYDDSFVGDEER